jgi:hypothetical protein
MREYPGLRMNKSDKAGLWNYWVSGIYILKNTTEHNASGTGALSILD